MGLGHGWGKKRAGTWLGEKEESSAEIALSFVWRIKGGAQGRMKPRAAPKNEKKNEKTKKKTPPKKMGWERRGKRGAPETLGKSPMAKREQRTWCVSTSEGARSEQVRKLVRDVSAFVDGKAGTKVEVVSGGDVRDVVEALKKVNPNVTERRRGAASGKGGLDVEVVVSEGSKEAAKFVARVDVVGKVAKAVRNRERAVSKARVVTGGNDEVVGDKMYRPKGGGSEEYAEGMGRWLSPARVCVLGRTSESILGLFFVHPLVVGACGW